MNYQNITDENVIFEQIIEGDRRALAKAITLVESTKLTDHDMAQRLISKCLSVNKESLRIGITGVPGVGKSTFIEALGNLLLNKGKKVAVLAVDPSSSQSRGSILGDKTRMETLSRSENAFIRPSPAGNTLGGVAKKTRETILLCEAAGFDTLLVETVGVGQSETTVYQMVDFFLLLKLAGAGDELQGIKRGIIEMADLVAINKADGANLTAAKTAKNHMAQALHLYPPKDNGWIPKVLLCSAAENQGIKEIWSAINNFVQHSKDSGHLERRRNIQNKSWFKETAQQLLTQHYQKIPGYNDLYSQLELEVASGAKSPFMAATELSDFLFHQKN